MRFDGLIGCGRMAGLAVTLCAFGPQVVAAPGSDLCERGRHQSPIDIVAPRRDPAAPALYADYRPVALRVVNDGHTVRVRVPPGQYLRLGRDSLTLQQMHFHVPGGDRIRGEDFPMAMHFLHKSASGRLVSLVLPFRLGAAHPALSALLPRLPAQGQAERPLGGERFDPASLLPPSLGYYRYEGSLTSAPCTEGVLWLVLSQPQTLSSDQLSRLERLFAHNARPVQPVHDRVVIERP